MIAVRVRTPVGTYRVNDVSPTDTFGVLRDRLLKEHKAEISGNFSLEAKGSKSSAVPDTMTVSEAGLVNGHMLHAEVASGTTMASASTSAASSGPARMTTIGRDGNIITTEISNTWASTMFGSSLVTKSGTKNTAAVLNGKTRVGIYFSAHWCPPCRQFTPLLAEFYEQLKSEDDSALEIIFVSSDRDSGSFEEYYSEMPWTAVPFSDRSTASSLGQQFGVRGIPAFIILDGNSGKTKDADGRSTVMAARGVTSRALSKW